MMMMIIFRHYRERERVKERYPPTRVTRQHKFELCNTARPSQQQLSACQFLCIRHANKLKVIFTISAFPVAGFRRNCIDGVLLGSTGPYLTGGLRVQPPPPEMLEKFCLI